jgi:hypothetical protein
MQNEEESQSGKPIQHGGTKRPPSGQEPVVPNPKLKLMDQVREVLGQALLDLMPLVNVAFTWGL